jgi:hypothetical protein
MSAHDYPFITRCRVRGTLEEVVGILSDPHGLPRGWPSVYLEVKELDLEPRLGDGAR